STALSSIQDLSNYLFVPATTFTLDNYVPCVPDLVCTDEIPACGPGGAPDYSQLESVFTAAAGAAAAMPYPQTINRVRLCDGTDLHLLSDEIAQISPGNYTILQSYSVQNATQDFSVATNVGEQELTLAQFLQKRLMEQIFRIADFPDCGEETNDGCVVWGDEIGCDPTTATAQMNTLASLPYYNNSCNETPATLYLSELCNGEQFYLSADELALLPGQVSIIHEVRLSDPDNPSVFTGSGVIAGQVQQVLQLSTIYCTRLQNQPRLELIVTDGCDIVSETVSVTCTTTIENDQITVSADPDSYTVQLTVTSTVAQTCDNGATVEEQQVSHTNAFQLATRFNERINFNALSEKLYVASLTVREVLTGATLNISLNPATLLGQYPNIENDLSNFSVDDLYFSPDQSFNASRSFNNRVRSAIRYIISQELEGGSDDFNLQMGSAFTAGAPGSSSYVDVNFSVGTMHSPTERGYVVDPCLGNFRLGLLLNNGATVHSVAVSMIASNITCRVAEPVNCIQSFATTNTANGTQKATCYKDGKDIACTYTFCDAWLPLPLCAPTGGINLQYELSPSVTAHNTNDLTAIIAPVNAQGYSATENCKTNVTNYVSSCPDTPGTCLDGDCAIDLCHPTAFSMDCSEPQAKAVRDALAELNVVFAGADTSTGSAGSAGAMNFPLEVAVVTFCTGDIRYLLPAELASLSVSYRLNRRLVLETPTTPLRITSGTTTAPGVLVDFLDTRVRDPETALALRPNDATSYPDNDPVTGLPTDGNTTPVRSPFSFYLYDHLGNTRVTFRADGPGALAVDYAADYYPYGKILREYRPCDANRYLTTHHERDKATGYDNRGARLYDAEIGRFLGVDPLAGKFQGWSTYNYVLGNPVRLVDPDGEAPQDIIVKMRKEGGTTYLDVTVRGKIVDMSSGTSSTDVSKFKDQINSINYFDGAFSHSMEGDEGQQRYELNVDFDFEVVSSLEDAGPNDHIIGIADEVP
ncbi:MAG: RHS repeat-associated core domain-containing protein, partial [Bacteroidota bacterium]